MNIMVELPAVHVQGRYRQQVTYKGAQYCNSEERLQYTNKYRIHKRMVWFQKLTRNLFLTLHGLVAHEKLGQLLLLMVYIVLM